MDLTNHAASDPFAELGMAQFVDRPNLMLLD
jgi:hypothetical protein